MSPGWEALAERGLSRLSLGYVLPAFAVAIYLIAWNRGVALLYGLFVLLVAIYLVGHLAPYWNLTGIQALRSHPATAVEGERVSLSIQLDKTGWRCAYMLSVHDQLPFAALSENQLLALVPRLKDKARLWIEVPCVLRGEHRLGPLQLSSGYPLGLKTHRRAIANSGSRLLVYPRAFPVRRLPLLDSSKVPMAGSRAAALAGGSDIFFGVREYRHGDSPRHVHWPASARRGELVVKELELINCTDLLIVLDLSRESVYGEGLHSTLEYAVKIAASIADYALAEGHGVKLFGIGERTWETRLGHGETHNRVVLELLARVRADGDTAYAEVLSRALGRMPRAGVVVVFENDTAAATQRLDARLLHASRHEALTIRFDSRSFERGPGVSLPRRLARADSTYQISCGDDLAGVFS